MAHTWHLQVSKRDWILWSYGGDRSVIHIAPANSLVDLGPELPEGGKFWFPFELPAGSGSLKQGRILDRINTWGWRLLSSSGHDAGWNLAESKEKALEDAEKYVETSWSIRNSNRDMFRAALKDVREVVVEGEPGPSPRDWSPQKYPK